MSTAAQSLDRHALVYARAAWSFLLFAALVCGAYVLTRSEAVGAVGFAAVAGGTVVAIIVGVRNHRPDTRFPWWCLAGASVAFLCGVVLRAVARDGASLPDAVPAAFTLLGYAAVAVALGVWLRARNPTANTDTVIDTVLVGLGAALGSWVVLIAPVLWSADGLSTDTAINAVYPVADAVLLTMLVHLAFTTVPGDRSFGLLAASLVAIFVGDLGYAVTSAGLASLPLAVLDACYLIGYGALGAGALHPSMSQLGHPQAQVFDRGRRQLVGVALAVVATMFVLAAVPAQGSTDRIVRTTLYGGLLLGVLLRSERAARRFATGERTARHRSTHDELTGLPNRALLHTRITAQLRGGVPLSLLFLDLDGFKFVNDSYGHEVGDELLVAAAGRLQGLIAPADTVARYGGDEFVVATCLQRAGTEGLATTILEVLDDPFTLSVGRVFVSASIGIARTGTTLRRGDVAALIREADAAMYHAKAMGAGGYAFFDDRLRAQAQTQIETSTALRDALAREEFEVHYQPIVDLADGRTVGYEALLRWEHNGRKHSPAEFIPIAEASNIIVPIGNWVLRTACTQLAAWRTRDPRLHMAVNVSARQLHDDALVRTVKTVLHDTGVPGSALWLELTETALVRDTTAALHTLRALHELGVLICLDDFGTGYSALGYLQTFPISVIKIDTSFVAALGEHPGESRIVGAIQQMARVLGLRTVAEGVETPQQENQLRRLGANMGQGWHFGYPLPAHSIDNPHRCAPRHALPINGAGPAATAPALRTGGIRGAEKQAP